MTHLERVTRARKRRASAEGAYATAIRDAAEAGIPIARIAEAAGVTRPTIYLLLSKTNESE